MSDGPPPAKRAHVTPRNSIAAAADVQTPFQHLHQLGRLINQPGRFQRSAGNPTTPGDASRAGVLAPSSGNRGTPRSGAFSTPGGSKTPNAPRSGGARSGLRKPTTPHGIRAQQQSQQARRYAGATPARDRRRSGRTLRETPRDDLRMLSRVLAPVTRPLATPHSAHGTARRRRSSAPQVFEDGSPVPEPPRLSMSRGDLFDDEIDSFHEAPPRMSVGLEDDGNVTGVEEGRRVAERRISMGRPSISFAEFGQFVDDEADEAGEDDEEDVYDQMGQLISEVFDSEVGDNETTRNLKLLENQDRSSLASGARPSLGDVDGNTTFQFVFPEQTRSKLSIHQPAQNAVQDEELIPEFDPGSMGGYEEEPDVQIDGDDDGMVDVDAELDDETAFNANDLNDYLGEDATTGRLDISTHEPTILSRTDISLHPTVKQPKKTLISRHGVEYPSLPNSVVKKLATTFARASGGNGKVGRDAVVALTEASDWFFEQMATDLAAYATHAKRKTIEDGDVITLMKRQRQLNDHSTVFSVAQKHLPGELLQAVRMPPAPVQGKKRKRLAVIAEEEES